MGYPLLYVLRFYVEMGPAKNNNKGNVRFQQRLNGFNPEGLDDGFELKVYVRPEFGLERPRDPSAG